MTSNRVVFRGIAGGVGLAMSIATGGLTIGSAQTRAGAGSAPGVGAAAGRPDLTGTYSFATATPLQRPTELGDKAVLSEVEAAQFEERSAQRRAAADVPRQDGSVGGYNQFWYEFGTKIVGDRRTSLIVDPPDGRLPALTPEAQKRAEFNRERLRRPAEDPEQRDAGERCIMGYNSGPPMVPAGYNQNVQLVQTPDYLLIHNEMVHTARVVPLDNRPHLAPQLKQWAGDSRGRWEGNTLVVETTNFNGQTWNQFSGWSWASDEHMRLVERFTRVDEKTVRYEFTVTNPTVWTKPWTAVVPLLDTGEQMFEYACHEGNYGLEGIMRGARAEEKRQHESSSAAPKP